MSERLSKAINGILRVGDSMKYTAPELLNEWFHRFGIACEELHNAAEAEGVMVNLTGPVFGAVRVKRD